MSCFGARQFCQSGLLLFVLLCACGDDRGSPVGGDSATTDSSLSDSSGGLQAGDLSSAASTNDTNSATGAKSPAKPSESISSVNPVPVDVAKARLAESKVTQTESSDQHVKALSDTLQQDLSAYGAYQGVVNSDFDILRDTPAFLNDTTLELSRWKNNGAEGMCHGMAYLAGYLATQGRFDANAEPEGVATTAFAASYASLGLIDLPVKGYADTRSYSEAQKSQYLGLVDFLQVERNFNLEFEQMVVNPALGNALPPQEKRYREIYEALYGGSLVVVAYIGNQGKAHAVLLYRIMRFEKADFLFVYDPNIVYSPQARYPTILVWDRKVQTISWTFNNKDMYGSTYTEILIASILPPQ